jgi:hypothetical protein
MQVRFVVMGNVFPTETKMHRKYDLKGSTYGRTAGVKKDLPGAILKVGGGGRGGGGPPIAPPHPIREDLILGRA